MILRQLDALLHMTANWHAVPYNTRVLRTAIALLNMRCASFQDM